MAYYTIVQCDRCKREVRATFPLELPEDWKRISQEEPGGQFSHYHLCSGCAAYVLSKLAGLIVKWKKLVPDNFSVCGTMLGILIELNIGRTDLDRLIDTIQACLETKKMLGQHTLIAEQAKAAWSVQVFARWCGFDCATVRETP